jgi:hypothetical protein
VECCSGQYRNNRNNDVHLYTNFGSVWRNNYDGCVDHVTDYANVHTDRASLPEQYNWHIARHIEQWHHRHMESCNDQHVNDRNDGLYLYSSCGPMWYDNDDGCGDHIADHTNVYADRATLPK